MQQYLRITSLILFLPIEFREALHRPMKRISIAILAGVLFAIPAAAQELPYGQRQALDRQERNLKEGQAKLQALQDGWAKEWSELDKPDMLVPPAWFKTYLTKADEVITKCDQMKVDLDKSGVPWEHERAKVIADWSTKARKAVEDMKTVIAPKLAKMEQLADPKNYPDLDADWKQMESLTSGYGLRNFASQPDRVAALAKEFPQVIAWCGEKYKTYKPLMVLTGGAKSVLYKRYERVAAAIKGFQEEAGKFFGQAEKEVPEFLKKAEEMAAKASAEKKPLFFTGGVRQQFNQADVFLKVCRSLVPAGDTRLKSLEDAYTASRKKVDELASTLKEQIIAETRLPDEKYSGEDKEALRGKILEAWKAAHPQDNVMLVRMQMEKFERRTRHVWDSSAKAWNFEDDSCLQVLVVVKTSDKIATWYVAYVNIDHVSNKTRYGVQTKNEQYVSTELLVENVK